MGVVQSQYNIANFSLESVWVNSGGRITSGPTTDRANKTLTVSMPQDAVFVSSSLQVSCGGTVGGAKVLRAGGHTLTPSTSNIVDISDVVDGAGEKTILFEFCDNGNASLSDGTHRMRMQFTNVIVTVTYNDSGEEPEPEPEPVIDHTPNNKIVIFPPKASDYSGNGIVVLNPITCDVEEAAGGSYEVELTHPMDEAGKWQYLIEDYLIRCPVPEQVTPRIEYDATALWRVKTDIEETPLYSALPYYTKAKTDVDNVIDNPSYYAWNANTLYQPNALVTYSGGIYRCVQENQNTNPTHPQYWSWVTKINGSSQSGSESGGSTVYHEGKVAEQIPGGQTIVFIADYNSTYFRARSLRGVTGYIRRNDCEQGTIAGQKIVIEPRMITEQVFRIYKVEIDSENQIVTVNARHKSYDYAGNTMMDCNVTEADANTAIAIMQGCLLNEDTRSIVCNIENGSITKDWSWQNPIYALLEPDEGIVPILKGKLIRDNDDFFILDNSNPRTGITLRYGVNLLGVTWSRSTEDVITRILPRGKNKDDTDLFLEELYIDSANIDDFPVVRVEVLDCDCKVGQQIEHADGTKQTLTEQDCYAKMREEAHKRFDTDKVDAVTVSLEVEFLLVGDTEEYKQYRGLQKVRLYDKIRIDHGPLGLDSTVQVSGYTFDAIMRRFKKITLGDVFSYGGRTVAGYNVNNGAITYQKLSPGLVKRIKSSE